MRLTYTSLLCLLRVVPFIFPWFYFERLSTCLVEPSSVDGKSTNETSCRLRVESPSAPETHHPSSGETLIFVKNKIFRMLHFDQRFRCACRRFEYFFLSGLTLPHRTLESLSTIERASSVRGVAICEHVRATLATCWKTLMLM